MRQGRNRNEEVDCVKRGNRKGALFGSRKSAPALIMIWFTSKKRCFTTFSEDGRERDADIVLYCMKYSVEDWDMTGVVYGSFCGAESKIFIVVNDRKEIVQGKTR